MENVVSDHPVSPFFLLMADVCVCVFACVSVLFCFSHRIFVLQNISLRN